MPTITGIEPQLKVKHRFNIYIDDAFAFSLCEELALRLKKGQVLLPQQIAELSKEDTFQQCYQAAIRFLSYRPRSTKEVRNRLLRKGFPEEVIEHTIKKLGERNLISDDAFARFWMDNRDSFSPRSKRMVQLELRRKGVSADIALMATAEIDELDAARRAAAKKVKGLSGMDEDVYRKKLSSFLTRRGFGWGTTKKVVEETIASIKPDKLEP